MWGCVRPPEVIDNVGVEDGVAGEDDVKQQALGWSMSSWRFRG